MTACFIIGTFFFEKQSTAGPVTYTVTASRLASMLRRFVISELQQQRGFADTTIFMDDGAPQHIACGGNHFGADCSKSCSPPQNTSNTDELCALHLFCKPDPYGCSCAPGFKGSKCMEHCEPGWYGADCKQPCHCAFGVSSCNRITGACDGGCARGWRGNSCQIEDPNANNTVETTTMVFCSPGTYGPSCEKECHCAGNEHCHIITGQCPYGCEDGWGGPSCGTCRENRFGENCEMTCHCEGGYRNCDKDGFCYSGCEAGWAGFTCQAECTPGRFGPNCASTCHCHENSTTPCDKVTGICESDCEAGYMGSDCQTLCPPNSYGVNCVETCVCSNGGHCNRVDGSCACDGRWRGLICNESKPPIIAASDEEVNIGQQVFISCTADAVPEPLMNISCSEFPGLNVNIRSLEQDQYQAVVKVKPQKAGTFDFLCTARNQHGFDMKKMVIVVIDPPVLTAKPVLVSKTNLSISIKWREWQYSKDIGGSPSDKIEYMAVYREVGAMVWDKVDGWATELSITITDLVPYTLYEVAVKCRRLGKGGEGEAGPSLKIKTDCGVSTADGIPQEFLPEKISESTVTLTWTQPTEAFLHCPLTGYRLIYHPESAETVLGIRDIGSDKTNAEVEDLSPNTVYVVHLYPITSIDMSKYFAELIFRTSETVPGPVSDLECQAIDGQPNLLLVSWEAPSEVNGAIKGYIITYTLMDRGQCGVSGDSDDSGMRQMQSDDTEVTLQNLYPYSTYNITVQARTSAGEGEGMSGTATTSEAAPNEPPQNIHVISVTSSSLEFGWDPVPCESANGIVIHYEYMVVSGYDIYPTILQRVKRSSEETDSHLLIVEGHQVKIGNLKPHTFYGFMVRGVTAAGSGPLSDIIFHKTEESVSSQPLFLDIVSVASEKLGVAWRQPESPNGEIIQYRAQVWDHELSHLTADITFNVTEDENDEGKFAKIIENLKPASDYFIKIQAATRAGWGAFSDPIPGRTLDGVPGEPSEIDVLENGQRAINITWQPPILKNGAITGYKVIYRPLSTLDPVFNATPFISLEKEVGGDVTDISLQDLHPSTEYNITVQAKTSAGYGRPAEIKTWTVILGDHVSPSVRAVEVEATNDTIPILFSTTGSTSVYKYQVIVEDARNSEPIDEDLLSDFDTAVVKQKLPYYIAAELDPQNVSSTGEHSFVVGDRKVWGGYKNVHLNPGHEYKIRIRTLVVKDQELKSVLSEPKEETAASTFVQVVHRKKPKIFGMEPIVFILILIALLVLITAITFLTILAIYSKRQRKKSTNSFSTRDSGLSGSMTWSVMYKVPDNEVIESPLVTSGFRTLPLIEKNASLKRSKSDSKIARGMRIETLEDFLINVRGTNQLVEEFKRLVEGQTSPWTAARKNCNLKKNRYGNILPYDRSRVVLHTDSNKSDSDYINASYIDGYRRPRECIVTQGPLENTITDFWRMIWQENSPVIVMVTDLVENGKKKCAKYWPDDSIMCDDMQILVIHSEESTDFVIRTILMRKMDEIRTHRVMQYQFTGWPDRSVPTNTNYFIKFLKKVRDDHPVMGGPMVVMCSAGAGRSGTYIAIDALCQQAAEDKRVDVFRFVNNARHQRIHFVQTLVCFL
ncbi:receptor-type tyrosine-protein phosphatase F-like [Stegodyphus dumicola]|uniref:receptor-type tyrosine-protein phosphatase F-like n=1 Tax=Stegodyphus dumicola TaxID=202533 RepID=UPI0015B31D41|nr:receptor-type tyrosine-protein phosphatase F-like [Stegodyphus dumicola]